MKYFQLHDQYSFVDDKGIVHSGGVAAEVDGYKVINCQQCGFLHIAPLPHASDLQVFYEEEFYQTERPAYFSNYEQDLEWWNSVYSARYDVLEQMLSPDKRCLLDVGSGPGYFLLFGQNRGWRVEGIEPSPAAVNYSRDLGIKVEQGFFDKNTLIENNSYDVIHMSEVLEHISNPGEILQVAYSKLTYGGMLVVCVPNDFNPIQYLAQQQSELPPWWVAPKHHINYFQKDSLSSLLKSNGFVVEKVTAMFPIDIFLLMGDVYIGDDALGRNCQQKRKKLEKAFIIGQQKHLLEKWYSGMAELDIGREIIIYARKV